MKEELSCSVKASNTCNDERFEKIYSQARELKSLLQELNEMVYRKSDELLGPSPASSCDTAKRTPGDCWVDKVIDEQNDAIGTGQETLERLSFV